MPDDKKLREAYNLLKQNNQFSKTKSYGEFQRKMDDRNYNSHIWKLLKDNGANVGHPYQFRAHLGVDEYNTANRKSNHVYSSNKPTGPSVPSDWGQLDTDAIGSGKMVGDVAKERATETEGNIQAMNDDVTNPHVKHAVQQGVTAQKNRLNNTDNQHTQQYGANWHHTAMLDKGIKGDVEAQKASGMPETAQQMQDNLQYEEATGKPLHNVLDVGMDKDRYGDITGSPAFAPTVQRDEQGNLVTDENGQPLIGMTSNEGNVREYGQQAQDEVVGQKKADIAESAKDGSLADESNKLFDALTSSDPQTKEDALHRLREIRSLGDDNANSILMKVFVDRQKDQNNEDLSNAKMQSDQDAGTDIAGMGALGKNEGDPYLVGAKEDTKNNVGTYAAIDNMLNDTESHLKEFHKEQDEQNSNWLVRNGAQTARGIGQELFNIKNWDFGITDLKDSNEMLKAVNAYKQHKATGAQMQLLQASALNNQVEDNYKLNDSYDLIGRTTGQMVPFMVQIALGSAPGMGKAVAKSLTGSLARNLPALAGKRFMGKTFSAISGRLASDMVDAGMTTLAVQGQNVAADTINRHIGDAQGGLDNSGHVKYTGQQGGESWDKSLYKATADAMFNNWSEYWGEYLPSVGHGMNKIAQKALDKVHLGAVNRFVAGADRSKGFQIYKNIRNRFELQGPFREWMEEMLGNSASAIATGDQSLSDIWSLQNMKDTALALSLGCGFGSITGGAVYLADVAGSKHSVHKAANRAAQAFGDKWDSVKDNVDRELDNAVSSGDNESVTDKITPQSMTPEQKKALSSYAMNRMYYRGMVYGVNAMMNDPQKPKDEKQVETSYIRGTDVDQPDDMNNIKREYVLQRQKVSSMVGDSAIADVDKDPMSFISNTNADQSKQQAILDYTNAKAAYDGMINNAHDDIESRVEDSNAAVDSHVNKSDNLIHPATMKLDDRPVYVVSGKMQMMQDGSMVDKANSDDSIIIRDGATGKLEMTSADQVQSVDEPIDPEQEKQEAANNIRQQFSQEKAEQIDGVLPFNAGDNYTFLGDDGKQHAAQIIGPDQNQENVLAVIDGNQQAVSVAKQELQQGVDNYKSTNIQSNNIESNQTQPNIGDDVQVNGDNGAPVHGVITGYDDLENKYMVQTDSPVNGKITQPYTSDQLILPSTDNVNIRTENGNEGTDNVNNITENGNSVPENGNFSEQDKHEKDIQQSSESEEKKEQPETPQRAIDRIPMQNVQDNKGNVATVHNWEQAAPQDTYDALKEVYQSNEDITKHKIGKRIDRLDKQIKDIQKKQDKLDDSYDFDADIANADTYKQLADGKEQLEQQKKYWQAVQSVPANRQIDAEKKVDEERKAAIEANEKAKAKDEENARVEREKLKGVPDVTNDKPADARSRGFRSVNGHQIQRQDATKGLTGKESNVKFSSKDVVQGHLKVIDVDQLQPSHVNGQRNPSFFIDEAQPKNRTDNVSSMAAEKIAANINPKEITGDGSAYQFSAPTVNTHGEVIQGNNRSDALKLMYSSPAYSEAQDAYKKYLMDHAEENGLNKDALSKIQHPVMVNELNVPDEEAIRLGQLTSKDNESGGVERIDPVTASRTLGNKVGRFANVLLGSSDEDESINDLMAANGNKAITWLSNQGAISPTQVQSSFDTKGNLTPEAKMDLQNILKQSLFQGGVSDLPTMFNTMPAKAQKAILSTFMRDFDSAEDDRILSEIQNAIEVWYEASKSAPEFAQAKNYEEAKRAMQGYTHQTSLTESSLPTEHYSNLAFELACRLQGLKMKGMQQTLSDYFDLVQGKTQPDLFGGETLGEQLKRADAIRKVFDIEYKPINNKYNGQERSNDMGSDAYESKKGGQREPGNDKDRGPDTQGTEYAERGGGIENNVQDQGNLHEGGRSKEQISKGSLSSSESGNGETTELKNNDHPEKPSVNKAIEEVRKDVDIHPTEAQIEAGNYKKGHLKIDGYDISIENPKGSYREGHDAGGKEWKVKMNYDYGYLKGTEGTDGDHIDVYLSDNPTDGNVYVVDQANQKTGKFDEHKVMYGFPSMEAARKAYASQYEKGWKIGPITEVSREEFKKWIDSSHRKTKPFAEYATVKNSDKENLQKLQKFAKEFDTTGRMSVDTEHYDKDNIYVPLKLDDKPSRLGVMTMLSDSIMDKPVEVATYDYSSEINKKANSGWQKWSDLSDAYNKTVDKEDRAIGTADTALLHFRSVEAAVKFNDWIENNNHKNDPQKQQGASNDDLSNDTPAKKAATDAIIKILKDNGHTIILVDDKEIPDESQKQAVKKRVDTLKKAADTISGWLRNKVNGKSITLELPQSTVKKIKGVMGDDFISHSITANSIIHSLKNHGEDGRKLTEKSIPLRKEDMELAPYIMTAPDRIERGSMSADGRASIRFIKELSNGHVIVVEKEQKNSPDDMETITMWAEKSPDVANALQKKSPALDAQNVITSTDIAKIKKDAETAIENDVKFQKQNIPSDKKYLKNDQGSVYGYTVGGKIYLFKKGLNPNTPIHEYSHLWTNAMMQQNPEEWENIKNLLNGTPVWDEVANDINYQNIKESNDEIASEVLSRISGRNNSKRIIEGMQKSIDEAKKNHDMFEMAEKMNVLQKIKDALHKFWNWVGKDLFHSKFKNVDEVADRVLYDMVEGTDLKDNSDEINKDNINTPNSNEATKTELPEKQAVPEAPSLNSSKKGISIGTTKSLKEVENSYDKEKRPLDESKDLTTGDDKKLYREKDNFEDGAQIPIEIKDVTNYHGLKGIIFSYSVKGINDTFKSKEALLDAFRNKYENYVSSISPDGKKIIVEPWSKYLKPKTGKYTKEQQAYIEQKTNNAQAAIDKFAHKLNLDNNVSVLTSTDHLEGRRAKAKGWYDLKTGKIVVVLPNHTSIDDVIRTLLHEGVAHYSLRKLFGQHFNDFLNNVYINSNEEVRKQIANLALKKYNGDFSIATEEHLASLAEDTDFERAMQQGWWGKVKNLFLNMLAKAGIKLKHALSDNDLRYVLWRSYKNLEGQDPYRNIFDKAEDVSIQSKLGVGNYNNDSTRYQQTKNYVPERNISNPLFTKAEQISHGIEPDLLFRNTIEDTDNTARETYNLMADEDKMKLREAWQDSMINVRNLQQAVLKQRNEKLEDWEDAYEMENRLHGVGRAQSEFFDRNLYNPMIKAVNEVAKRANVSIGDVTEYMIAKSGLERNEVFANRDADTWFAKAQKNADIKHTAFLAAGDSKKADKVKYPTQQDWNDTYNKYREKDYSGLTALTGKNNNAEAEQEAKRIVNDIEKRTDTDKLWSKINNATQWTLTKSYESGIISRENYNKVKTMFHYYIPLRGWKEDTAGDIYDYVSSGDKGTAFNPVLKKANGRKSEADNPIAYIDNMAVNSIIQGNKNRLKQTFLTFVQNHPTNLVSVSEMWYRNYGTDTAPDWKEDVPYIPEDATADEIANIMQQHEQSMEQLAQKGLATKERGHLHLNVPVKKNEALEHHIVVNRNGKQYVLYINGNPRAAQALNGTRVQKISEHSSESQRIAQLGRKLAERYTSLSPAFTVSNAFRDITMAAITTFIKENPMYAFRFRKNILKLGGPTRMFNLMYKYNKDTLEMNNSTERMFYEFMTKGAETGFTSLKEIEEYKTDMAKEFSNMNQCIANPKRIFRSISNGLEYVNRCIEDMTRFATYMASRQSGRSINHSITDAKNITLNFNRKGSGEKGNATYRNVQIFVNPAIQSLQNVANMAVNNPVKFTLTTGSISLIGLAQPFINMLLASMIGGSGGDDNKDKFNVMQEYWKLPTWQRRNNLVMWIPGTQKFSMVPLAQEFRVFHGFGETLASVITGNSSENPALEVACQASDLLPLDFTGNNGNPLVNLAPTITQPLLQIGFNTDFTGRPLYNDNDYNKYEPSFQKAYIGTPSWLIKNSQMINELTGGNDHKQGWLERSKAGAELNNPAVVDHLLKGYYGGLYSFFAQLGGCIFTAANGKVPDMQNIPVLNRIVTAPRTNEKSGKMKMPNDYYQYLEDEKRLETERSGYKKDMKSGSKQAEQEYMRLMDSNNKENKRYQIEHGYLTEIKKLKSILLQTDKDQDKKEIKDDIYNLYQKMKDDLTKLDSDTSSKDNKE